MITAAHLRAARALLNLSVDDIAATAGISPETISAAESGLEQDPDILRLLHQALEERGIVFLPDYEVSEGGIGVRLRQPGGANEQGLRPEQLNAANDD